MANFLDVAENLLRSGRVQAKSDHFDMVFSAIGHLQAVHSKAQLDLINIESVFNALVMARILGRFPGQSTFTGEKEEAAIKQLIATTLEQTQRFRVQRNRYLAPVPYDSFAMLLRKLRSHAQRRRSVAVLTFNYDVGADLALHIEGLGPAYALDDKDPANSVPLLKLHGSLNWAVCSKCRKVVPWHLSDFFISAGRPLEDTEELRFNVWSGHFTRLRHCDEFVVHDIPFIVPPTWNKGDHHQTIAPVWQRAALELSEAEHIFVIGYSLPETDGFFRTLYALGVVGDKPLKSFEVFNPENYDGPVNARFKSLLGLGAQARYQYHPTDFHNAIPYLINKFDAR
jgi:NAD-dependent SIR2 family protein deacetylase